MRFVPILLVPLTACGLTGAMHQATLVGQCANDDVACSRRHPLAPLAIGAHFHPEVATDAASSSTPSLHLESVASDVLAVDGDSLIAKRAGASAVLISTDDGSVVDFVHIWVAPVTQITVTRRDGERIDGTIGLTVGEDVTLAPALWNGAQRLSGEADAQWTLQSSDASLTMLRDGSTDRRRLRARAPGKSTVTVALGDAKTSIELEVVP
jgi:hypothetical protein